MSTTHYFTNLSPTNPREALDYPSILSILMPPAHEDVQAAIESLVIDLDDALDEAELPVDTARAAVESHIDGTLDEPALLADGEASEQWLSDNPSPHDTETA